MSRNVAAVAAYISGGRDDEAARMEARAKAIRAKHTEKNPQEKRGNELDLGHSYFETSYGVIPIFDRFRDAEGQLRGIRPFYDPRPNLWSRGLALRILRLFEPQQDHSYYVARPMCR